MSLWDFDLGPGSSWPDWFREHWEARKAKAWERARAAVEAQERGVEPGAGLMAQFKEDRELDRRWRASLSSEQRAWIEEQEAWDRACATYHVPPDEWKEVVEPRMARAKALGLTHPDPVRAFVLAVNTRTPEQEATFRARVARVTARAAEVLGSQDAAARWLKRPSRTLGDRFPIGRLETAAGEQQVFEVLDLLERGWQPTVPPHSS